MRDFRNQMDDLNGFMRSESLPSEMRQASGLSECPANKLLAPATGRGATVSYTQRVRDRSRLAPALTKAEPFLLHARQRLREYFHQSYPLRKELAYKKLFVDMSPALHRQVVIHCNTRWMGRVWFLRNASEGFKFDVSRHLQIRLFAPKELVPTGELNIVHRGDAMYGGKILGRGQTWGEDIILSSAKLRVARVAPAHT